jgi:putative ABC transport system permease protein
MSCKEQRFNMLLLGSFAVLAVALAGVGIYGMVAYRVNQLTHEIGVDIALGAQHRDVLQLVIKDGVKLGLLGIVRGLAGAMALTRVTASLLFEAEPTDPATLMGVALLLIALHSPDCVTETGLRVCSPEKSARKLPRDVDGATFSGAV